MEEFYSNGKLLLTGEYAILDGAKGLALPTKFGQHLKIKHSKTGILNWRSLNETNTVWFSADFQIDKLKLLSTSDEDIAQRLRTILNEAKHLNPTFLNQYNGCFVDSELTFPRVWGLGSSSTLINNIANWAKINPYQLLDATFGGSGYDIACASHNRPIVYHKNNLIPNFDEVAFKPEFLDHLFFIYLNQKKNSRDAIDAYRKLEFNKIDLVIGVNEITEQIIECTRLSDFETLLNMHENLLSKTLKIPTIKEQLFKDYTGSLKSLGAWGGDFILATGNIQKMEYFKNKGYTTILNYTDIIL
ncbi:GYDIA family GHMP kinase [Maribacter sp. CXY002]|uniref:GYDIA family GHMP kinase n=1 Tax=Maribacter luteocoastalis TaxID=3407671 RepID=UPI003B67D278